MQTVLIVIHLLIVLALVVVVLIQRSEGGGLGMGGGSGGGLMTARGAANMLTRTTAILATLFFITSMALAIMARYGSDPLDILNRVPAGQTAPGAAPAAGGSLLDQLGGLPDQSSTNGGVPAGGTSANGAAPAAAPTTPAPAQNQGGVPTGADAAPAQQIPANPAPQAPNARSQPTVPPVEAPAPGATNGAASTTPAQPAQ